VKVTDLFSSVSWFVSWCRVSQYQVRWGLGCTFVFYGVEIVLVVYGGVFNGAGGVDFQKAVRALDATVFRRCTRVGS